MHEQSGSAWPQWWPRWTGLPARSRCVNAGGQGVGVLEGVLLVKNNNLTLEITLL